MDEMRGRYKMPRRDYAQPARRPAHIPESLKGAYQPPPQPKTTHDTHSQPPRHERPAAAYHAPRPKRRLRRAIISLFIILTAAAVGGLWAYPRYAAADPFPADIRSQAGTSLLYPKKLPAGYSVDPSTMHLTSGVLIYAANKGGPRLIFTIQKTPPSFDFETFYKKELTNSQQFLTPYGQAIIGKNQDRYLGSLVAGDTWLLLSTNNTDISLNDMSLVMNNLKRY
jgi:hypothetical protein